MIVSGTVLTLLIACTAYRLGVLIERQRQEACNEKKYRRRCRLTAKECREGFFSKYEPNA